MHAANVCLFFFKKNKSFVNRIPLKKFPSMRTIYSEFGTNVQDLTELGEMLKYKFGGPDVGTPTPEALKNYMDVSIVAHSPSL